MRQRTKNFPTTIALIWIIMQFAGCATQNPQTNNSKQYIVTARFFRPADTVLGTIEVTTRPNVPFAVERQDADTNRYRFSGTLRRKSDKVFFLDRMELSYPSTFVGTGRSEELTPGIESTTWTVDAIFLGGYGLEVRAWPSGGTGAFGTTNAVPSHENPIPPGFGALFTGYAIPTTNTVGGPAIPIGTPVYVSIMYGTNTGPISPANVTVGPGNTYLNVLGIYRSPGGTDPVPESGPSATAWPAAPPLPIWLPCTYTNIETIYTKGPDGSFTNLGTISRIVTVSAPSYPSINGAVTVKPYP